LVLHPAADPAVIRFRFEGAGRPEISPSGDLLLRTGIGELRQHRPQVWQDLGSQKRSIECRYEVGSGGEVGLVLGSYDHSAELTIDPILSFSTYLGGNSIDFINGIAVDSSGVYVAGSTQSTNFPVTAGARHDAKGLFVTKFNLTGTALIYSTVIGGGIAEGIALDNAGAAYITGNAGATFPDNGLQSPNGGYAFGMKLDSTGTIVYATLLSGNQGGEGHAIAVDAAGAAYIAGITYSSNFPTTPGAFQTAFGGVTDALVVKFSPTGQVVYSTYLGGNDYDGANAIVVDNAGNAYVAGSARSTNFPTTNGAYSTTPKGNDDAFVTVLNSSGSGLVNSTLLGGTSADRATGIARDGSGNLYVTGIIDMSVGTGTFDFPTTPGAFAQNSIGSPLMFMAKLNSSLSTLMYCGHIGGMINASAIAVDLNGSAYFTGTASLGFPTTPGALETAQLALGSIFMAVLSPAGDVLSYATLLGGTSGTNATSLALDGNGGVYLAGTAGGFDYPTTGGVLQPSPPKVSTGTTGGSGVVAKIDLSSTTSCTTTLSASAAPLAGIGGTFSFTFTRPAGCPWFVSADTVGVGVTSQTFGVGATSPISVSATVPPNPDTTPRSVGIRVAEKSFTIIQAGASCQQPVVSPLPLALDSTGAAQNVNVVLPSTCTWTAASNAPWLVVGNLGPFSSLNGSRTITISAAPLGFSQRSATITIATKTFNVTQAGSGACTVSAQATLSSVGSSGATGEIRVIPSGASCTWQAYSYVPWIQLATTNTGQGSGSVPYSVAPNPGTLARAGQVLVGDQFIAITQSAGPEGVVSGYTQSLVATGTNLNSVFFDANTGNLYFSDLVGLVSVITPDGNTQIVAGGGTQTGENIPAASAQIIDPFVVTADGSGNIYFGGPAKIWKVSQGLLSTFAGTGVPGFSGDNGPAISAQLTGITGLAFDSSNTLYISDAGNKRVRSVANGNITTFAGGDVKANLAGPTGITLDSVGDVLFMDVQTIWKVAQGTISALPISGATLSSPQSMAFDSQGNLLIGDYSRLLKRGPNGSTSIVSPQVGAIGVTTDLSGYVYVAAGQALLKLTAVTSCNYSLGQMPLQAGPAGGNVSLTVTVPAGCNWTAISDLPWATITSGTAGGGSGTIQILIAPNPATRRSGSIAVAGQAVSITQPGASDVTLTLSPNRLNFGASGPVVSSPQSVVLSLTNGTAVNWTASSNQPNVVVSPPSGTGSAILQITATSGASAVVTFTAAGATNTPQQILVNVTATTANPPFGSFDTPPDNASGIAGAIPVTGWALDNVEIANVGIWREPIGHEVTAPNGLVFIGNATLVAGARPDVAATFPNAPWNYRAGWGYMLLTNFLPNSSSAPGSGNGVYKLHAIAMNKAGMALDLGTRTITVDNGHGSKPFGTIDTPGQGATVSGNTFVNFGWALTQNPYKIPIDGSTLTVFVDGVPLGHPTYNQYRSDIATFFPGFANSNGAVGFFYIDTTQFSNGVHTIAWSVTDNQGRADGIGSRYFTIQNLGAENIPSESVQSLSGRPPGLRGGFDLQREREYLSPDNTGTYSVEMAELGRIELELGATNGYLLVNGQPMSLPIGSTLKEGIFYWQPGPGYLGTYDLAFTRLRADSSAFDQHVKVHILSPNQLPH
jgi:hypothetical protein